MNKKSNVPSSTDHQAIPQARHHAKNQTKYPTKVKPKNQSDIKTSRHASRYSIIGVSLALFNYILYSIIANVIIKNNDYLWFTSFVATAFTAILAYILHSKITWKERDPGKTGVYKFIIWNIILTFLISPVLTQIFSFTTGLYSLAYDICTFLHIPFSYDFIQSTGAFILANAVIMIINFLFYDRLVFDKKVTA